MGTTTKRQTSWKGGKIETLGNQIPDNDRDSKPSSNNNTGKEKLSGCHALN